MAPKVQVQPGFMPPGDDVMALVTEVGTALRTMLKNEQEGNALRKSEGEHVATSDPQTVKTDGKKGSGEKVATSDPQTIAKAEGSASSASPSASFAKGEGSSASPSASFAKGEDEGSPPSASAGSPSASAGGPPEGSASASAGSPSAGGEGSPAGAPPAEGAPGAEGAAPGQEAAAAGPSFEELVQMYAQLSPEDLQAHMAAIEQAAQATAGAAAAPGAAPGGAPAPGASPAPAPSAGPAAMPPPSAGPGPSAPPPSAGPGMPPPMGKSESDSFMAELKKTQDQVAAVAQCVEAIVTMPRRKAVNGLSVIPYQGKDLAKSETGSKPNFETLKKDPAALHAELKKMTMPDSGLSKSERDIVTDFYCRRIGVDGLAPIFADKK